MGLVLLRVAIRLHLNLARVTLQAYLRLAVLITVHLQLPPFLSFSSSQFAL